MAADESPHPVDVDGDEQSRELMADGAAWTGGDPRIAKVVSTVTDSENLWRKAVLNPEGELATCLDGQGDPTGPRTRQQSTRQKVPNAVPRRLKPVLSACAGALRASAVPSSSA